MSGTRVPFDLALPVVVAAQELACGPKKLKRGDPLPWRDLGVSELDLAGMYLANQVDCLQPAVSPPSDISEHDRKRRRR